MSSANPRRVATTGERRLIINADDLGFSESINAAIFAVMDADLITSATVMANGNAVSQAIEYARQHPDRSFGVHLNITWGVPVGPAHRLAPLLGADGHFTRKVFDIRIDAALRHAVTDEWYAQVESLRSKGLPISHLDSHQHVHTLPPLFLALKDVQRRTGIRRVRLSKNIYCRDLPPSSSVLLAKKAVWNGALRHYHRTRTTDGFSDLYSVLRAAREGRLAPGLIEAMVHPGESNDPYMVEELRELHAGAIADLPVPIRLVSYHVL